jgi:SAM-dependent methyltransferase
MGEPITPFDEFERRGWGDAGLATAYDEHLSALTRQSVEPLLDAARVEAGTRVLDVATGPGYAAAAASARGAAATGLDFSVELIALARALNPGTTPVQGRDGAALRTDRGRRASNTARRASDPDVFLREASGPRSGGRIAVATWGRRARRSAGLPSRRSAAR